MNPALLLLLRLKLWGFLRRGLRTARTPKGALLSLLGCFMFFPWIWSVFAAQRFPFTVSGDATLRYGPLALLVYTILMLLSASGERLLYYTPAEVSFLFTGPFRQRELLAYKLVSLTLGTLLSSAIFTAVMPYLRKSWIAGIVGMFLAMMFFQLLSIIVGLTLSTAGALARTNLRRAVLGVLVVLLVAAGISAGNRLLEMDWKPAEIFAQIESSPVVKVATLPFRPFVYAFAAERAWPDLAIWGGICLAIVLVEFAVVFALNATYAEAMATSSAKLYERLQRMRRGGAFASVRTPKQGKAGRPKVQMADLPYWGGVGPTFWRQFLGAVREPMRLVFSMVMVVIPVIVMALVPNRSVAGRGVVLGAEAMILWITVLLTPATPFDFRGDIDRMESLKTMPIPSWALAIGQLLTPVLLLSVPQILALWTAAIRFGVSDGATYLLILMLVPAVFQVIAFENLVFLLFPTRLLAATPGDFTAIGRQILLMFGKLAGAGASLGLSALIGFGVYWAFSSSEIPGVLAAFACLSLFAFATVPFVAWAYDRYDVARDTPA